MGCCEARSRGPGVERAGTHARKAICSKLVFGVTLDVASTPFFPLRFECLSSKDTSMCIVDKV